MSKAAGVLAATLAATVLAGGAGAAAAGPRTSAALDLSRPPVVQAVVGMSSATDTATPRIPTAPRPVRLQQSGVLVTTVTTGATPTVTVSTRPGSSTVWTLTNRTRYSGLVRKAVDLKAGMRVNLGGPHTGTASPVAEHVVTPATKGNRAVAERAATKAAATKAAATKKAAAAKAAAGKKAAATTAAATKRAAADAEAVRAEAAKADGRRDDRPGSTPKDSRGRGRGRA